MTSTVSILIPTRGRPEYLDVALESVVGQARDAGAEVVVIDDGHDPRTAAVAARHGVRVLTAGAGTGANGARNVGVAATESELVVLLDDDIRADPDWLAALLAGARDAPEHDVFGGPIRAALQDGPHSCGREGAPITTLDLGSADRDADLVWSANMAIRRRALARIGPFDESLRGRGEEEDWERRYAAAGGRIRYLARAGVTHRRCGADAGLRSLTRAAYALGRTARRYDVRKGSAPPLAAEIRTLLGCAVHVVRYRCTNMIAVGGHAAGRLREAVVRR